MPWENQKKLLKVRLPTAEETRNKILGVKNTKERYICAILYLTGSRCSEICGLARRNIWNETINGRVCLVLKLENKKNKKTKEKILPIPIDEEPSLVAVIAEYLNDHSFTEDDIIIDSNRKKIYDIIKKNLGWNPHYVRHLRITHLTVNKKYTELQLVKWAGWTDARPATTYVSMDYTNLV